MAHTRQSRPDFSLGFQLIAPELFEGVASSLERGSLNTLHAEEEEEEEE